MRHLILALTGLLIIGTAIASEPVQRTLTFEDRVDAQRAIEQVYWNHRIWPKENPGAKPPLSTVMSDDAIRAKVEDDLKKSNALEKWWQRPISGEQLQAEMDRMAKNTRDSAVLRELYRALGNDPFVIAETLARQTLADRLLHNWYANDTRFHGVLKTKALAALASCNNVGCMRSMGGQYFETTWKRGQEDSAFRSDERPGSHVVRLDAEEWKGQVELLAREFRTDSGALATQTLSGLQESEESFHVTAIVAQGSDELTTANVAWTKESFANWWGAAATTLDVSLATPAKAYSLAAPLADGCVVDTWSPTSVWIEPRANHTAVWTGTEMIIWGGESFGSSVFPLNTGGRYNPATDSWVPTSTGPNAPEPNQNQTAVWTGTEMIVWGYSGGRYNPATDSWTRTSTGANYPGGREQHTAVWTGTEMIVWGGIGGHYFNSGGRYDPVTDSWMATSTGPFVPDARVADTAVWTGTEMIVWGGRNGSQFFNTGGRYNPVTDTWVAISTGAFVPVARIAHTAVWTGTEMIVWGGLASDTMTSFNTGGRYSPASDSWLATSVGPNVPSARRYHTAVWTGTEMIVWGGAGGGGTGGRYDPSSDSWASTSTGANLPLSRKNHTAVWTGSEMIVWGGISGSTISSYLNTGGRYDPSNDAWVPTSTESIVPAPRFGNTTLWTGSEMIVWGGQVGETVVNTGSRYNPATDSWIATQTGANVPDARENHVAVWTGTEMIVWGGNAGLYLNSGGRYDPAGDSWMPTSTGLLVPEARTGHTAVWTGNEMIVWGGRDASHSFNTGGRYDPSSDGWLSTTTGANAPTGRQDHTAVWTGTEMIVWGGVAGGLTLNTGGRYDPSADSWASTSTGANVPSAREYHTAVWTGSEMLVWGGFTGATWLNTGGRYDP